MFGAELRLDWIDALGGKVERDGANHITGVSLRGTWVTDTELLDLVRIPTLVHLDLSHTRISDEGMLYLRPAKQIVDLNLFYAEQITDQGMSAIRDWKHLRHLNLRGTRISNGAMAIIGTLPELESVDVAYTQITAVGLDALSSLTRLKDLSLSILGGFRGSSGKTNDAALEILRLLPTLQTLDLGGPHSGAGGKLGHATAPMSSSLPTAVSQLKDLRVLKLTYSEIDANGLQILSALPNLQKLLLNESEYVDDKAVAQLAQYPSLKYVDVQGTKVTQAGVTALQKAKPGINVLFAAPKDRLSGVTTPQVICSGAGSTTSISSSATLGTCVLPAGLLHNGDRIEIRYHYSHLSTAVGFTAQVEWAGTPVVVRSGSVDDLGFAGTLDFAIGGGKQSWSGQSWGTSLPFATALGTTSENTNQDVPIIFQGGIGSTNATDAVSLSSYTVIRYPAPVSQ